MWAEVVWYIANCCAFVDTFWLIWCLMHRIVYLCNSGNLARILIKLFGWMLVCRMLVLCLWHDDCFFDVNAWSDTIAQLNEILLDSFYCFNHLLRFTYFVDECSFHDTCLNCHKAFQDRPLSFQLLHKYVLHLTSIQLILILFSIQSLPMFKHNTNIPNWTRSGEGHTTITSVSLLVSVCV